MGKIDNAMAGLLDIRIALVKADFDPDEYNGSLVIGSDYQEAYCMKDGSPLPEHAYESASLKIIGFDEPFDGYAYDLTIPTPEGESMVASGTFKGDSKKLFADIKAKLLLHVHESKPVINAFDKIIVAAWGFDCDSDEIQEEALDKLKKVECVAAFYGADAVDTEGINFAGGLFAEVTPYEMQLMSIAEDGKITSTDERDIEEVRKEGDRFVFALRDK